MKLPRINNHPITEQERANYRHLTRDVFWFGLAFPSTSRFLSVYAIRLGAGAEALGWLTALPYIILLIVSTFAPRWRKRYPSTVAALFWPGLGYRLIFLLPAFTPLFPRAFQPYWLLLTAALPAFAQDFIGAVPGRAARKRRWAHAGGPDESSHGQVQSGGRADDRRLRRVADQTPFPLNYQVMYVVAFALSLVSLYHVQSLREIAPATLPEPVKGAGRALLKTSAFRRVASTTTLVHLTFYAILPVIPLWLVRRFDANEEFMSIFGLVEIAAAALLASQTSRIMERIGSRMTVDRHGADRRRGGGAGGRSQPTGDARLGGDFRRGVDGRRISVFTYFTRTPRQRTSPISRPYITRLCRWRCSWDRCSARRSRARCQT